MLKDLLTQSCVVCGKSELNNSTEEFEVNTALSCRHKFCQSCTLDQFRKKGNKFSCPNCNSDVSREKLKSSKSVDPDQLETESDNSNRQQYKAIFNKSREDFTTLEEFEEYQEQFETIIYNLVHGINVDITLGEIKKYKEENGAYIARKHAQRGGEDERRRRHLEEEHRQREQSMRTLQEELRQEKEATDIKRKRSKTLSLLEENNSGEKVVSLSDLESSANSAQQDHQVLFISETHPLLSLLRKYPVPQIVTPQPPRVRVEDPRKIHVVGGYDYSIIYHARTLAEIKYQLNS